MTVPEFSVRQVVLVNFIFAVCLLGGFAVYTRTPVDLYPDIGFNLAVVESVWTGASADEVERLVTTRIEDELGDLDGVKAIRSVSRANVSSIFVEFDENLSDGEYEAGVNDLRAAVDRVGDLPADAEEPVIRELSSKEVYADLRVAVVDTGGVGDVVVHELADDLQARLERLAGIEKVSVRGRHEREVRVLVDRDAAARYGLTVVEIAARIPRENLNLPAGSFNDRSGEATLRATGDYESLEVILDTVVRHGANGSDVRLSDVARIETELEKRQLYVRYNGSPALVLGIAKRNEADILELSRRVSAFLAEYEPVVPAGVELHKTWDMSVWVASRMGVIWDNLVTGVVLVMAILWFTVGFRNAALTIIAIPFSFLTAIILFPVLDITINATSLVGMLLVSGLVVDDAIIVLENVYRRVEEGAPLREAVIGGTQEVLWPVIAAVATTCAAFLPLLMIGGTAGRFMVALPKTVVVCLVASLLECLVILPAHYLDFGSRGGRRGPVALDAGGVRGALLRLGARADRLRAAVDAGLAALRRRYLDALDVVVTHSAAFAALGAGVLVLAGGLASHLPVDLFPGEATYFFVRLEAPTDYGLERTDAVSKGVEGALAARIGSEVEDFFTIVGTAIAGNDENRVAPNLAVSFVWIPDSAEYRTDPAAAMQAVQGRLAAYRVSRADDVVKLEAKPPRIGPPIGRPVAVRVISDDYALAKSIALELQAHLETIPGVENVEDNLVEGQREVRLVVDEDRAARHGLAFEELATALRGANDGLVASSYRDPARGDELDIRVLLEPHQRRGLEDLLQTEVRAPAGHMVKLGDVAGVEIARGFVQYWHFDRQRSVTVYADVDGRSATALSVNQALAARFADVSLRHPEVELTFGGEFESTKRALEDIRRIFWLALVLIYGILATLFRSYAQPLIVVSAVPFGIVGMIAGTWLMGYTVSMYMLWAGLGLTGVVVNDSLVMVSFINRARAEGMTLREAVRVSGGRRLRPILLTTLTTVAALLPMAMGVHGGSASFGPFAASIAFGLTVAMAGTLFAVPLAYTALVRAQDWTGERLRGRSPGTSARARTSSEPGRLR